MNIGITCHPSHGGSGAVAAELGKHLADRGHSVHFISYDLPFRLDAVRPNLQFHQVEVPSYPLFVYPPYQLALANKMAEVVQYEGLDILHAHYAVPHAASAYLARAMTGGRVKVITTLHGTDVTLVGADPSFAGIIKFLLETSDGVTAVSDDLKRVTIERFGVTQPIERIYNFIDPEVYQRVPAPDLARRFTPGKERVALHISNFRPLKRVPLAVEAFAAAAHDIPAVLLLAGDGPEAGEARATARRLRVASRVHFLGTLDRVVEVCSLADVFLLPSTQESFGLAALEAMACEVPVVCSRVGGLPEVVADGETGYLCAVDDAPAFIAGVRAILKDPELRQELGRAARRRACELFAAEGIIGLYEDYYRRVLEADPR